MVDLIAVTRNVVYSFPFFERLSLSSNAGCKLEPFFLNIEAVNTHREKPVVRFHRKFVTVNQLLKVIGLNC